MPSTKASLAMPLGGRTGFARAAGLTRAALPRRRVPLHAFKEEGVEAVGEVVGVAAWLEPGVGPVRRGEHEQCRGRVVEVAAQLAELPPFAEEGSDALLVAAALAEDLLAPVALQVAPLLHEDGRDVELVCHDSEVRAKRQLDLLGDRKVLRDRVQPRVEGPRALEHRLVEQVLLRGDVRVERAFLDAERPGDLADRRAVVALLGEQPRRLPRQLVSPGRHGGTLTTVRYGSARAGVPGIRPVRRPGRDRRLA